MNASSPPLPTHLHRRSPCVRSLLAATLLGALVPSLQAANPVELKAQWPVGQRLVSRMASTQNQRILGSPTGPMNQEIVQHHEIAVDVTRALPDGGHELTAQFLSLDMEMKTGSITTLSYDSSNPASVGSNNPIEEVFGQLMKTRPTLVLDARGDVVKVSGLDALMQDLAGSGGLSTAILQAAFNKDSLKQMVGVPQGLPAKPVQVGDRWPYQTEISMGPLGAMRLSMFFTFRSLETRHGRSCVQLDYTGSVFGKAGAAGGPIAIQVTGGSLKGKTWFDPADGLLVETTGEQDLTLRIHALGQQMTIISNQKTSQTLVRVEPIPDP